MKSIRLDKNEMPYSPPQKVVKAAKEGAKNLNRYSSVEQAEKLRELLSNYSNVPKERIIFGSGSDLLLQEIIRVFSPARRIITVSPSFFPTVDAAKKYGKELIRIRLSPPEFDLDLDSLLDKLEGPSLVVVDNPNNPTGKLLVEKEDALKILKSTNTLLVVDEAYYEFSGVTFSSLLEEYSNLAVTRTLDKAFSLAGARLGYLIAGKDFLESLAPSGTYFPKPSLLAGIEALKDTGYAEKNVNLIMEEKKRVKARLTDIGIQARPTSTNFLLFNTELPDMVRKLRKKGIFVKDLSHRWLSGYIRVTVGKPEENDIFLTKIRDSVRSD
ncbi:histidinol-phosphate aminotransferase family protein [Candidatus Bipolaricaulota bacterium]|nr:histidinol-phosphate aminotransferase family protein [Candidatus Bipolaricaulota bacterium]MBS3792354.1 histidinol-phosphate aminotransferase family protein [Candidatus Bipolaricaulota bacterium]